MQYNKCIKSSPKISQIGIGAWQLGVNSGWKGLKEKEAIELVEKALEAGINFFDTAPNYGLGSSESRLGKVLKGVKRHELVINTKFGHTVEGTTNYSARYIRESLEGSLKRLQTDYVDSLIIHNPPFEYLNGHQTDHYEILEKLKDEGKIRAYGASVDSAREMKLLMETTQSEVIEAFFNILHQDTAQAFDLALKKEVGIIVKIPYDSGWLTGKYNNKSRFKDIRSRWSEEDINLRADLINKIQNILGSKHDLAQAALAFCLSYQAVSTVIPGNTNLLQLSNNLKNAEKPLAKNLVQKLEQFYKDEVEKHALPW